MGRRQIRYFKGDFSDTEKFLSYDMINVVMDTGEVFAGKVTNFTEESLTIRHYRHKTIKLSIDNIKQIIVDHKADY